MKSIGGWVLLALLLTSPPAWAEDLYFGQSAAGGDTGANCANQHSAVWFNTAANWGGGAGEIDPGDTAHLCGTVTSNLQIKGSGTSGNPITLFWETGAKLSIPFCTLSPVCLATEGNDFLILDGGTNGIVEETANGVSLANQQAGQLINAENSSDLEIKNLTLRNCYVRTQGQAADIENQPAVRQRGTYANFSFHHNTVHDCATSVEFVADQTLSNITIYNNDIYNVNAGMVFGGLSRVTQSNITIYENHIHDTANWDTPSNQYHHNGIFIFGPPVACCASTTILTGVKVYNNLFDGDIGNNATSHGVYLAEIEVPDILIFNNVSKLSNNPTSALALFPLGAYNGSVVSVYNNTLKCNAAGANLSAIFTGPTNGPVSDYKIRNNLIVNCGGFLSLDTDFSTYSTLNYNVYVRSDAASWNREAVFYSTIATWRTATSDEANSQYSAGSDGLDASHRPLTGSIVIDAGTNLTSLGITQLNSDKDGRARPGSGAWEVGAYEFDTSAARRFSPRLYLRRAALDEALLPVRAPDTLHLIDW